MEYPQTDAVLLVHNDDFSTRDVINADSNGEMSLTVQPEDTVTVSFFTTRNADSGKPELTVDTYIDANPASIREKFYSSHLDDEQCECTDVNLQLSNTVLAEEPYEVTVNNNYLSSNWTPGTSYIEHATTVCRAPGENWPTITATMEFYSERYSGFISYYDPTKTISLQVDNLARSVDIGWSRNNPYANVISTSATIIDDNAIFFNFGDSSQAERKFIYPDPEVKFYTFINDLETQDMPLDDPEIDFVRVSSFGQRYFTEPPTQRVVFDHIDYNMLEAELLHSSELDSFDFSAAGIQLMEISSYFEDVDGNNVLNWNITSSASGDFSALDEIELADSNHPLLTNQNIVLSPNVELDMSVYRFNDINTYTQALEAKEIGPYSGRHNLTSGYDYIKASFFLNEYFFD